MLSKLGYDSMDAFITDTVPQKIRVSSTSVDNNSIPVFSESQLHARAKALGGQNVSFKSYIGMGYHCAVVPPVILRNVGLVSHPAFPKFIYVSGHGKSRMVYAVYTLPA
jgi:glycine dehydrogenase